MKKYNLQVQNLKCGGCANTITKELSKVKGVRNVSVSLEQGSVGFELEENSQINAVTRVLTIIGYPIESQVNKLQTKVKSYFSCLTGKASG